MKKAVPAVTAVAVLSTTPIEPFDQRDVFMAHSDDGMWISAITSAHDTHTVFFFNALHTAHPSVVGLTRSFARGTSVAWSGFTVDRANYNITTGWMVVLFTDDAIMYHKFDLHGNQLFCHSIRTNRLDICKICCTLVGGDKALVIQTSDIFIIDARHTGDVLRTIQRTPYDDGWLRRQMHLLVDGGVPTAEDEIALTDALRPDNPPQAASFYRGTSGSIATVGDLYVKCDEKRLTLGLYRDVEFGHNVLGFDYIGHVPFLLPVHHAVILFDGTLLVCMCDRIVHCVLSPSLRRLTTDPVSCIRREKETAHLAINALYSIDSADDQGKRIKHSKHTESGTPLPLLVLTCFVFEDVRVIEMLLLKGTEE